MTSLPRKSVYFNDTERTTGTSAWDIPGIRQPRHGYFRTGVEIRTARCCCWAVRRQNRLHNEPSKINTLSWYDIIGLNVARRQKEQKQKKRLFADKKHKINTVRSTRGKHLRSKTTDRSTNQQNTYKKRRKGKPSANQSTNQLINKSPVAPGDNLIVAESMNARRKICQVIITLSASGR